MTREEAAEEVDRLQNKFPSGSNNQAYYTAKIAFAEAMGFSANPHWACRDMALSVMITGKMAPERVVAIARNCFYLLR